MDDLSKNIKLIRDLRKRYNESKMKEFGEARKEWALITLECAKNGISEDLILMDENVFELMTESAIDAFKTYIKTN